MPRPCSICTDPMRILHIQPRIDAGWGPYKIQQWSISPEAKALGITTRCQIPTIQRHLQHRPAPVNTPTGRFSNPVIYGTPATPPPLQTVFPLASSGAPSMPANVQQSLHSADIAKLVAQKGAENIESGEARVTTAHALQAQQILDRREEKRKDREVIVAIAAMLTGMAPPPSVVHIVNVTPQEPESDMELVSP